MKLFFPSLTWAIEAGDKVETQNRTWAAYKADQGSSSYSPLDQITG